MNFRFTTMTAVVALMLFAPVGGYAQDAPATPPGAAAAQDTPAASPGPATAQDNPPAPPGAAAENVAATPPGTVAPSAVDTKSVTYTQQQLDQMLAPIALYPDQLMSQILMASTFPLQIVEAARWLENPRNAALKGDALVSALQPMNWDPSVKSVTAFPAIVKLLNKNLDWTDSLGVAFTHQQSDVMAQIQFLRHQAQDAGNLKSNDKIVCRNDGSNIVIASANPRAVYAPYYNPAVVYGTWPWAAYPPVYFAPSYFGIGPIGFGVAWGWGSAWPIVPAFWGWYGMNWGMGGGIFINGGGYSQIAYGHAAWGGGNWQHPGGAIAHGGFTRGVGSTGGAATTRIGRTSAAHAGFAGTHAGGARAGGGHASAAHYTAHAGGGHAGAAHATGGAHAGGSGGGHGAGGGHAGGGGGHAGGGGGGHGGGHRG